MHIYVYMYVYMYMYIYKPVIRQPTTLLGPLKSNRLGQVVVL